MKSRDITGLKFNKLTALEFSHKTFISKRSGFIPFWKFKCDCGNIIVSNKHNVVNNKVQSCGCVSGIKLITHNFSKTRFYSIFHKALYRCTNNGCERYDRYGGRGIKFLWNSFEDFKDDMYESYLEHVSVFGEKETTIERIDNDGDYCKENCRWATWYEQSQNRSK